MNKYLSDIHKDNNLSKYYDTYNELNESLYKKLLKLIMK